MPVTKAKKQSAPSPIITSIALINPSRAFSGFFINSPPAIFLSRPPILILLTIPLSCPTNSLKNFLNRFFRENPALSPAILCVDDPDSLDFDNLFRIQRKTGAIFSINSFLKNFQRIAPCGHAFKPDFYQIIP